MTTQRKRFPPTPMLELANGYFKQLTLKCTHQCGLKKNNGETPEKKAIEDHEKGVGEIPDPEVGQVQ